MTPTQISMDPAKAVFSAKSAIPRCVAVLAGLAGATLPVLTATMFGATQSLPLPWAAALSALAALALISPAIALISPAIAPMRAFGRLLDILALVAGLAVLAYAAYLYVDGSQQLAGMAGMNGLGAAASITPGPGLWAIVIATLAMGIAALIGHRR
ncbi:MAG TPA: hypothetical protein VN036_13090 [Devosia sp.]|nr:hypothetical protein [Devosia sp.]